MVMATTLLVQLRNFATILIRLESPLSETYEDELQAAHEAAVCTLAGSGML